jgi:gluconolactonase
MASSITKVVHVDAARAVIDPSYARSFSATSSFVVYNERFQRDVLGDSPRLTKVEERDYQFAHEAGVYCRATNSVYFTANFQTCNPIHLYTINCDTHAISRVNYPGVVQANGACQYQDRLLYCSQGDRSVPSSLVLVDPVTEKCETLINNFHGREFSSVNDVVVHHETGDIWFTDPTYGYEQGFRPEPTLPVQVYRFRPSTRECWLVADGFEQCNGLCFSPDYKLLYVTDTGAVQAHNGPGDGHQLLINLRKPGTIYVYDVVGEGRRLANRRTFAFCDTGIPDGIKCDEHGNVYSGCGDGVHVWDPEGTMIGKIVVGNTTANFCFAKGGMWLFAETALYFCEIKADGALVHIECE